MKKTNNAMGWAYSPAPAANDLVELAWDFDDVDDATLLAELRADLVSEAAQCNQWLREERDMAELFAEIEADGYIKGDR